MFRHSASVWAAARRASTCAAALVLVSCSTWMPIPPPAPGVLPAATHLQIWRGGQAVALREVTIEADSIRGRVVDRLRARPAGRLVIPRAEVDSFRILPRDNGNWFGMGLGAGILGSILVPYLLRRIGPEGT